MTRHLGWLATLALLGACADGTGGTVSRAATAPEPPPAKEKDAEGHCWATEITPAVYTQVMGQVQVVQAQRAPDGTVIQPPVYRNAPVPKLVTPRGEMRFEAPCPEAMTPEFISTVQRALYARGYLRGAITGQVDRPTQAAIRRYQSERGLDSAQLSLETARDLGVIAVSLERG